MSMDSVNHPKHYNQVPNVECIDIVRHFNFNRGNAIKYIWRAGSKGNEIEDLQKAVWYLNDEIKQLSAGVDDKTINYLESLYSIPWHEYSAKWWAVDEDQRAYFFADRPTADEEGGFGWLTKDGNFTRDIKYKGQYNHIPWKETLRERPAMR